MSARSEQDDIFEYVQNISETKKENETKSETKKENETNSILKINQKYYDSLGPSVILGSVFEKELSDEFQYPLITLAFPVTNRVVFNRTYAGFNGGLTLVEDVFSSLVAGR